MSANNCGKKISIVIPCYRSEKTVSYVTDSIREIMDKNPKYPYEVILVNDGSPDDTLRVINEIALADEHVKAVDLSRNFGQHSALMAGYSLVTGDYVVGMDDDGEHHPEDIFKLIDKLEEGFDYVCASFPENSHSRFKRLGSRVNDWMATNFVGKPKAAIFSSFYIMRRFVVDEIVKCKNPFPYVGGMIVSITKKMSSVTIQQHSRKAGVSNYNLKRSLSLWINGFTAFSVKPLRIATFIGIIVALIGFLYGIVTVLRKIFLPGILAGYSSLIAVMLFMSGILMINLGLMGEYVGRIYISLNKFPQFVIRDITQKETDEQQNNIIL